MGIGTAGGSGLRKAGGGAPSRSMVCHANAPAKFAGRILSPTLSSDFKLPDYRRRLRHSGALPGLKDINTRGSDPARDELCLCGIPASAAAAEAVRAALAKSRAAVSS